MYVYVSFILVTTRGAFWGDEETRRCYRSRRRLRSLSLSLLLFITVITLATWNPINRQFYRAFNVISYVQREQPRAFPPLSAGDKLTNDIKSNAIEHRPPRRHQERDAHHFCRRCGRMFGNKSYPPPVLYGRSAGPWQRDRVFVSRLILSSVSPNDYPSLSLSLPPFLSLPLDTREDGRPWHACR